jgi:hypothetical protein
MSLYIERNPAETLVFHVGIIVQLPHHLIGSKFLKCRIGEINLIRWVLLHFNWSNEYRQSLQQKQKLIR